MSSTQLATIEKSLFDLRPMFEALLRPTGVTAERIIRTVVISCDRTPKLLECTKPSILQAATTGAVLGLEADGVTGQGFLVPFKQKGTLKAQWITGYKGYPTLGARNGMSISGEVVREDDEFVYRLGTDPFVHHVPKLGGSMKRRIIGAYATATHPSRPPIIVVMDIDRIHAIRDKVLARRANPRRKRDDDDGEEDGFTPWQDPGVGFEAMARKTPIRALGRFLPLSVYTMAAVVDEAHEELRQHAYINPKREVVIEGKATKIAEPQPKGPALEQLERLQFKMHKGRNDATFDTIEQWRGAMLQVIQQLNSDDKVANFYDMNQPLMEEYSLDHRAHVQAVYAAFKKRLKNHRQGRLI